MSLNKSLFVLTTLALLAIGMATLYEGMNADIDSTNSADSRRSINPAPADHPVINERQTAHNTSAVQWLGRLVDDQGNPLADGDVLYQWVGHKESLDCSEHFPADFNLSNQTRHTRSRDNGQFFLDSSQHSSGCLIINASRQGYSASMVTMNPDASGLDLIEIELQRHGIISGTVMAEGAAIANARVSVWLASNSSPGNTSPCDTFDNTTLIEQNSLATGAFIFHADRDNDYCLSATHPDWAGSDPQLVAAPLHNIELTLMPPQTLRGNVVDTHQRPVANVELQLTSTALPTNVRPITNRQNTSVLSAKTDAYGFFHITGLDDEVYQVQSASPQCAIAQPTDIDMSTLATKDVTLVAYPTTLINGRVVTPTGDPASGVQISSRSPYVPDKSTVSTLTDANGIFSLSSQHQSNTVQTQLQMADAWRQTPSTTEAITPPTLTDPHVICIGFYHPNHGATELSLSTQDAQLDLGTVFLTEPRIRIHGQVTNHRSQPQPATLALRRQQHHRKMSSNCADTSTTVTVTTNDAGEFDFNLEQTGDYEIEIKTDRYQPRKQLRTIDSSTTRLEIRIE